MNGQQQAYFGSRKLFQMAKHFFVMRERVLYAVRQHWDALGYWPRSGPVAQLCALPPSTTTETIRRLTEEGLLKHPPYGKVQLTPAGDAVVDEYLRHKRLLEVLLVSELKLDHDTASQVATQIAMQVPCPVVKRICTKYGHPTHCPVGHRIPNHGDCRCEVSGHDG
jgi:Mn-dependent DtxR family transcriptional regulator